MVQNRLGIAAVRTFHNEIAPVLSIEWVDAELHEIGMATTLGAARKNLSFVDCSTFAAMRRLGIDTVFTFDKHFAEQGFDVLG